MADKSNDLIFENNLSDASHVSSTTPNTALLRSDRLRMGQRNVPAVRKGVKGRRLVQPCQAIDRGSNGMNACHGNDWLGILHVKIFNIV